MGATLLAGKHEGSPIVPGQQPTIMTPMGAHGATHAQEVSLHGFQFPAPAPHPTLEPEGARKAAQVPWRRGLLSEPFAEYLFWGKTKHIKTQITFRPHHIEVCKVADNADNGSWIISAR